MNDPRLTAYALGELDAAEMKKVEELISTNPEARREVEKIRRMAGRLRSELGGPPTAGTSAWRALAAAVMGVGLIAAVTFYVFFPTKPAMDEKAPISAKMLLDPPVEINPELRNQVEEDWQTIGLRIKGPEGAAAKAIQEVVVQGIPELRRCYRFGKGFTKDAPSPVFTWSVDADGKLIQLKSDKSGGDQLEACMAQTMTRWQFPQANAGPMSYQFKLTPRSQKVPR